MVTACLANRQRQTATLKYQPCGKRSQERRLKRLRECYCERKTQRDL